MAMDIDTAINTVTAILTSIIMVMAMDMEEMKIKNNEIYNLIILIQKNHRSTVVFL